MPWKLHRYWPLSFWMTIYVLALLVILIWNIYAYQISEVEQLRFEIGLRHLLLMCALTFPIGPVFLFLTTQIMSVKLTGFSEIAVVWAACVVGSLVQWVVIFPVLTSKFGRPKS